MNSDNQKPKGNNLPQSSQPFKGNAEIIKNLSTLPENSGDKEDLLSQVAPEELNRPTNQQQNNPAQNEEGSNESK